MNPALENLFGEEYKAKKNIRGAVDHVEASEEQRLWSDCPVLRPKDHVNWLHHFIALELNVSRLIAGWIPATPSLEWRMEMPYFMFEDMRHAKCLRERLAELSKSSAGIEPSGAILGLLESIAPAESAASFFHEMFGQLKPAILEGYRHYLQRCDEILDGPTVYLLKQIILEKERQMDFAKKIFQADPLVPTDSKDAFDYAAHVKSCLELLGSLAPGCEAAIPFPANPIRDPVGPAPALELHDPKLKRSDRYPESTRDSPVHGTLREIVYHMATEWQVISPMCYAYYKLTKMPFEFFVDFSRHIWDECRHAKVGFRRLRELGFAIDDFIWPSADQPPESVEDFVTMLTLIGEACSFKRKRGSIIPFLRRGDYRSAILPTVDCSDEQLHVSYGARWVPEIYKRYRADERQLSEIAQEVRETFLDKYIEKNKINVLEPGKVKQINRNLPLFCSAIEFSNLDFSEY